MIVFLHFHAHTSLLVQPRGILVDLAVSIEYLHYALNVSLSKSRSARASGLNTPFLIGGKSCIGRRAADAGRSSGFVGSVGETPLINVLMLGMVGRDVGETDTLLGDWSCRPFKIESCRGSPPDASSEGNLREDGGVSRSVDDNAGGGGGGAGYDD